MCLTIFLPIAKVSSSEINIWWKLLAYRLPSMKPRSILRSSTLSMPCCSIYAMHTCLLFIFELLLMSPMSAGAASFQQEMALREKLFSIHSSKIRPVLNQTTKIIVDIEFFLQSVQDLNAKNQVLKTSGYAALSWMNEISTWELDDYGGLDEILVGQNRVWLPDLTVDNGANGYIFIGSSDFLVSLHHTGRTRWSPGDIFETQCTIDVTRYPFDTQICEIRFTLWMNSASRVELNAITPKVNFKVFNENGEWDVSDSKVQSETVAFEDLYNFFKCELHLKRRSAYHVINTVLPILFLSVLNVLVFVLPPEAGEKMSLSITVLLAYAVFLSIVNEDMPITSTSVSILAVYLLFILALGTTSTFLSAIVLHYSHFEQGESRKFFSFDCFRHRKGSLGTGYHEQNGRVSLNSRCSVCVQQSRENSIGHMSPEERACAAKARMSKILFRKKTRDLVDRIDVISFWVFLLTTVLGFVILILILLFPS